MAHKRISEQSALPCACGGGMASTCCEPFLLQKSVPETAEQLMRSRYSAFVLKNSEYLLSTWHPDTRPSDLNLVNDQTRWLGLEVKDQQNMDATHAEVEFVARFKEGGGPAHRLHERSRFERINGRWYYLDGDIK